MTTRYVYGLAALSLALASPALATPATPEEAQRLTALFERYVGHPANGEPGSVTVTPEGEAYKADLDLGRLLAPLRSTGLNVTKAGSFAMMLTPQPDGTWHVTAGGVPPVSVDLDGQVTSLAFNGYTLDGVFDPKIGTFKSSTSGSAGSTLHSEGPKGSSDVQTTGQMTGTSSAEDAGDGSANTKSSSVFQAPAYRFSATGAEPSPTSVAVDAHAARMEATLSGTNERIGGLLDLWAFMVAHPSKPMLIASQSELKTRLKALIPFASDLSGEVKASNLVVNTPQGQFAVGDFFEHYDLKDTTSTTVRMSGFSMPAGLVPAWAAGLVPTGLDVTQTYGPLALSAALMAGIDDLDLSAVKPLTDEQTADVVQSLTPTGNTLLTIAPSTVTTPLVTVKFAGEVRMSKPMPTGTATVSVTGLDKAIDQITAAAPDDPSAAQAIQFLSSVKVFAKAEGLDSYSWRIEALPGQDITVNGNRLGGAPAVAKPRPHKKKLEP